MPVTLLLLFVSLVAGSPAPQRGAAPAAPAAPEQATAPAAQTRTYAAKCASCHGPAMTGASAPAILTYVRYHTNADVMGVLRTRKPAHPAVTLSEAEMTAVLADLRVL